MTAARRAEDVTTPPQDRSSREASAPLQNGGSIHSAKNTRRSAILEPRQPRSRSFPCIRDASSSPRSGAPSRAASTRTVSATSANVRGSSDITSASTGQADASSPLDTAHTAHRSCVRITSGASESISSASRVYNERPSPTDERTVSSISRLDMLEGRSAPPSPPASQPPRAASDTHPTPLPTNQPTPAAPRSPSHSEGTSRSAPARL